MRPLIMIHTFSDMAVAVRILRGRGDFVRVRGCVDPDAPAFARGHSAGSEGGVGSLHGRHGDRSVVCWPGRAAGVATSF